MDTEQIVYVSVAVLSAAWVLLAMFTIYLWGQHRKLSKYIEEISSVSKFRVQKVKMQSDTNHAYQNPTIAPGEELSRRGYSMYSGEPDVESGHAQGQNSNAVFVEDVVSRNPNRQSQPPMPNNAPPFLLNSIEANKRKSLSNPIANNNQRQTNRHSSSNPNFIY